MKMKKYLIIALLATLALSGCKNFLVQDPILSQSTEIALSDYNGLNTAVGGAYSILADGTWYGGQGVVLDAEMRAGNAMIPTNPDFTSGRGTVPYTLNYNVSSTSGLWGYAYYMISAVNNVLEVIDTKGEELIVTGVTKADVNNLQAEALFLRALAHFDLIRTYANLSDLTSMGVPVILKTDKTAQEMPARNTVTEGYTQIIADLVKAEGLISGSFKRSGVSDAKAVCSKDAIQALLARVYLYSHDYAKASEYATKVIDSGNYKLWTKAEYPAVWGKDAPTGGEIIFEVYGIKSNSYDEYWEGPSHLTNPLGYGDFAASNDLVGQFAAGDVRGTTGVRGKDEGKAMFCTDADEASGGQLWTMKYQGKGFGDAVGTPDVNNVIVLRLSEMYLIRAEAAVNGSGSTAVADINAIRTARGAAAIAAAGAEAVATERRLELNWEGHRWYDLGRTTQVLVYTDGVGDKNLAAGNKLWALPIPKRETDVNANLVQNPGY